MKTLFATLALATGLAGPFAAQAADTAPSDMTTAAQVAMQTALGDRARDLTVTVSQGVARIGGWALQPHDVDLARYAVSQVPGITHAYSGGAHTWRATDRL